jgi:anti-anti-sigma factor
MKLSLMPLEDNELFQVRCTGPITLRGSDPHSEPLAELLGPHCFSHRILLNCGGTEWIDTSGIAWLSRIRNAFEEAAGSLVLYEVPPIVRGMFDFLGLTPLFCMADNVDSARARALPAPPSANGNHQVLAFQVAL